MTDQPRRGAAGRDHRALAQRIQDTAGDLFTETLNVFHAFTGLDALSEDLRVLSLNAELAAGRAGNAGRAVRALTQYTRELVNRLNHARETMIALNARNYRTSAGVLRSLHGMRVYEQALERLERERRQAARANEDSAAINSVMQRLGTINSDGHHEVGKEVLSLLDDQRQLSSLTKTISEVISQSDSIATNMAIEAALAGSHEGEFRTVAQTMSSYVEQLRNMVDAAGLPLRQAEEKGRALSALVHSQSSRRKGNTAA